MTTGRTAATHLIEADHHAAAAVRHRVRRTLRHEGWGHGAELVVLALGEALTNAIEHGSVPGAPIEVQITTTGDHATIRVTDRGRPGSARTRVTPRAGGHGRGLAIMGALADRLEIHAIGPGTRVSLEFTCPAVLRTPAHDVAGASIRTMKTSPRRTSGSFVSPAAVVVPAAWSSTA